MRVERVRINKKRYYFVDGVKITGEALSAVIKGVYGADVCCKMYQDIFGKGFAVLEQYVGSGNEQLIEQLDRANKKKRRARKESHGVDYQKYLLGTSNGVGAGACMSHSSLSARERV